MPLRVTSINFSDTERPAPAPACEGRGDDAQGEPTVRVTKLRGGLPRLPTAVMMIQRAASTRLPVAGPGFGPLRFPTRLEPLLGFVPGPGVGGCSVTAAEEQLRCFDAFTGPGSDSPYSDEYSQTRINLKQNIIWGCPST
jgi:hypothetical protein